MVLLQLKRSERKKWLPKDPLITLCLMELSTYINICRTVFIFYNYTLKWKSCYLMDTVGSYDKLGKKT